ncbi:Hypothetical protein SMAX5B_013329 [Scophthalmus maximus]|uniref:Uncharacterized protein n=1 Tax=Scophthalmus maximus TaxID=52904 RepID=A0A2U9B511_SCOMX|nr:Hypothetical protein SMAX5B_013329 [Scophthalmus maximus]
MEWSRFASTSVYLVPLSSMPVAQDMPKMGLPPWPAAHEEVKRYHRYCNHSGGPALPKAERIQRAWRARMSRRGSWQGQDESLTSHHQGETVPSESQQQDPGMTTDISPGSYWWRWSGCQLALCPDL